MAGGGYQPLLRKEASTLGQLVLDSCPLSSPQADLVKSTYRTLYGLQTNVEYEVRVRCKSLPGKAFGDFSDSAFVLIPSEGKDSGQKLSDRLTVNACVGDDVSMCVSFRRVTLSSRGLAPFWNSVCGGHPDAGGHFTAGKVRPFSSSPL